MNKTLHILRHEIISLVSRFSFWFGVLGVPVLAFVIYSGIALVNQNQGAEEGIPSPFSGVGEVFTAPQEDRPQGYVDLAGLAQEIPPGFPQNQLVPYPDEPAAAQDLERGVISAYFVIPEDYLQRGQLRVYVQEFSLIQSDQGSNQVRRLLEFNLLGGDPQFTELIRQPIASLEEVNLAPTGTVTRDQDSELTFFLPYGTMMILFITIMGSAGLLLNSVAKEKENRIMEVLMVSSSPRELLMGKILGLGVVGLLQVVIWGLSAFSLLRLSGRTFDLPAEFLLDPSILAWGLVFFTLGYLIYAALMAGIGALVPNLREASQATFIVTIPMMAPLFILSALIEAPNGPLATAFSLFPLTAPTTMMLRLSSTTVPLWQLLLSIVLLVLTAFLVIRAVAGMFRAQTLLSGQQFKMKMFFLALVGKA
jgi:ABC-2 type transport system permease protein